MGSLTSSKPGEDQIVISASDAREIARLLKLLEASVTNRVNDNCAQETHLQASSFDQPSRAKLIAKAKAVFVERNRRTEYLSRAMFGEPAWDMLICLYILNGARVTFGKLVNMIGEPMTTAVRWIDYLEKEHLVARRADPNDRRLVCIELLDRGREILDSYFNSFPDDRIAHG
jgi:DNA-binding MarR family transcriptional regulator